MTTYFSAPKFDLNNGFQRILSNQVDNVTNSLHLLEVSPVEVLFLCYVKKFKKMEDVSFVYV